MKALRKMMVVSVVLLVSVLITVPTVFAKSNSILLCDQNLQQGGEVGIQSHGLNPCGVMGVRIYDSGQEMATVAMTVTSSHGTMAYVDWNYDLYKKSGSSWIKVDYRNGTDWPYSNKWNRTVLHDVSKWGKGDYKVKMYVSAIHLGDGLRCTGSMWSDPAYID